MMRQCKSVTKFLGYLRRPLYTSTSVVIPNSEVPNNELPNLKGLDPDYKVNATGCIHKKFYHNGNEGNSHLRDMNARFLVTGASGQIGQELVPLLRNIYGSNNVIASDVRMNDAMALFGPFVYCDVTDKHNLKNIIISNNITYIVHLATILSATGEKNPQIALKVNTTGIQNILELAADDNLSVFAPSTIAVFGDTTPKLETPDTTVMQPNTMYGITKVHQELLGAYYARKYGVDFRALRYPGIISSKALPGGGTTDYAVEIFYGALEQKSYKCFLARDTTLPMMYMPDCLKATWNLMMSPKDKLSQTTYNVTAMSFSPEQLAYSIKKFIPGFKMDYAPDYREHIARTWPASIDDSLARRDWSWMPEYDIDKMTEDMLVELEAKLRNPQINQKTAISMCE